MGAGDTKERILDAAERLFGERGFLGTSLRAVTTAARVNVAAVHYHFGSKEALLGAVIGRRIAPVNERRWKLLEEAEVSARGKPIPLEAILETLLAPALQLGADMDREGSSVRRIVGRLYSEPIEIVAPLIEQQFGALTKRYLDVLGRTLPGLPREALAWRFHFAIGVMVHVIAANHELAAASGTHPPLGNAEAALSRMVEFLAAGFRAEGPEVAGG